MTAPIAFGWSDARIILRLGTPIFLMAARHAGAHAQFARLPSLAPIAMTSIAPPAEARYSGLWQNIFDIEQTSLARGVPTESSPAAFQNSNAAPPSKSAKLGSLANWAWAPACRARRVGALLSKSFSSR
jgi:hypothetical protein